VRKKQAVEGDKQLQRNNPGFISSCRSTEAEAAAWQELVNRLVVKWEGRLADPDKTLYIRYGRLPSNGQSRNYATGRPEAGGFGVSGKKGDTLFGMLFRTPYLVGGAYIDEGSDGGPLLGDRAQDCTSLL
jgi:hypothetical protein